MFAGRLGNIADHGNSDAVSHLILRQNIACRDILIGSASDIYHSNFWEKDETLFFYCGNPADDGVRG